MDVSLYLKRPDSKTETSIFARISYYGQRLKFYLPEKILPVYWNKKTQLAREARKFPDYAEFNTRIRNITGDIKTAIRKYMNDNGGQFPSPELLKEVLNQQIKFVGVAKKQDFFDFYEMMIEEAGKGLRINHKSGKPLKKDSTKVYTTVLNHLKQYALEKNVKIDFDSIDLDFYNSYTEYLSNTCNLSLNTIGNNIKTIKLVLNEATERGLNTNLKFKSKRFITLREESENIYLNEKEVAALSALDLSKDKANERVRDLFLVGCYTGLRFSDFSALNSSQIKKGFIEIKQIKTEYPVVIPVHPELKRIIAKYGNGLPPAISNQKMNQYLKVIAGKVKDLEIQLSLSTTKGGERVTEVFQKSQLITTHTARRSFATNEYLAGTPALTIMAITGHKTEKAFMKYIKVTSKEHAEILKATWDSRQMEKEEKQKTLKK